jgi:hypothetical protein
MNTFEFLSQLNEAEKEWGLWVDRQQPDDHHVGHYSYETDHLPESFAHAGSLEELAHQRQKYILENAASNQSEEALGQQWAEGFLSQWQGQWTD